MALPLRRTSCRMLLGGGALLFAAAPAVAQNVGAAPDNSTAPAAVAQNVNAAPADNSEIIVTAQRRAERLQDAPQSVTSLSGESLARLGANQFVDFANTVPGLQFTTLGAGSSQISMRGVTTGADVGPTVGIYVDDVPFGSSSSFANGRAARAGRGPVRHRPDRGAARSSGNALRGKLDRRGAQICHPIAVADRL